jgi:PadR family transcriptional regulator PadR
MVKARDKLIPGTLNILILKSLTWGPLHGYAISKWVLERTEEVLRVEEGVLYPALHRLEKEGCLEAEWGRNDTGRRAKFYSLTPIGFKRLEMETARWRRSAKAVETVLELTGA